MAFDFWNDAFGHSADFFLFLSAGIAFLFVITYQLTAHWEKSEWGWNLMGVTFFLLLVLTLGVGATVFGTNFPGRQLLRTFIFLGTAVFLAQRLYLLLKVQVIGKLPKKKFFAGLRDKRARSNPTEKKEKTDV